MTIRYEFFQNVPSWTKLGSAEFFRLVENPNTSESYIKDESERLKISFDPIGYSLEAEDEDSLSEFLKNIADWYTNYRLSAPINYDFLIKIDNNGNSTLVPVNRPHTYDFIPSNPSNIKPSRIKEIKYEDLEKNLQTQYDQIITMGYKDIPAARFKKAKVYDKERYIQFNVINDSGKKGNCFACGRNDYLTEAKGIQYPLIVGLDQYANFYSYHAGKVGFCRFCALSNHFAFGRVMFNISNQLMFIGIPQATSIKDLQEFLSLIDLSHRTISYVQEVVKISKDNPLLIANSSAFTNFVERSFYKPGFYFTILVLLVSLSNTAKAVVEQFRSDQEINNADKDLINALFPDMNLDEEISSKISKIIFRSWEFILFKGEQGVRFWRFNNSQKIINYINKIKENCKVGNLLSIIQKLIYESGDNVIDTQREDFSRSLLMGVPNTEILERSVWGMMSSGSRIDWEMTSLALCLAKDRIGGNQMEKDEVLRQCRMIGMEIAELSAEEKSKDFLYDLRSVGNSQALRSYIERYTFMSALKNKPTKISDAFIEKLFKGDEWKVYKSIIAIVANQNYSHLSKQSEV